MKGGSNPRIGDHAVVLGASLGGLLAARVLADFYDSVTVVERDMLPDSPEHRRGVPQGRHVHALLGRGIQVLSELFPGFETELATAGTPVFDYRDLSQAFLCGGGHQMTRTGEFRDIAPLLFPSRPLLEYIVRQRVRHIPNVTIKEGYDLVELTSTTTADRVTGARILPRDGATDRILAADLVVDSTGRGSRTPNFLERFGYGRPREEHVTVDLVYSSQLLRIPPGMLAERIVLVGPVPGRPTGMALFGYENNTWMFTVFGMAGHEPPDRLAEMVALAEGHVPAHVLAAISAATPVSEVCRFRYPRSCWRRYDKMSSFPARLLVLGDAFCSFNPIYGEGMTVAALQAQALQRCLRTGYSEALKQRYFRAAAKPVKAAWRFAAGGDLALPEIEGPRPVSTRLTNRYVDAVQLAAEHDARVAEKLTKVAGFLSPPAALLYPQIVLRVLAAKLRQLRDRQQNGAETPTGVGVPLGGVCAYRYAHSRKTSG